jgi:hypothetical protein
MAGKFVIHRKKNDCGCKTPMRIIITDCVDEETIGYVSNGWTSSYDIAHGIYSIYVESGCKDNGVRSNICSDLRISDDEINLSAEFFNNGGNFAVKLTLL